MDNQIQQVGFLPDATHYGEHAGEYFASTQPADNKHPPTDQHAQEPSGDHWVCSDKQKELILRLVEQHQLDKQAVEALAKEMFGLPVKTLNRLQASGLIEELLERHGKAGGKNGNRMPTGVSTCLALAALAAGFSRQ